VNILFIIVSLLLPLAIWGLWGVVHPSVILLMVATVAALRFRAFLQENIKYLLPIGLTLGAAAFWIPELTTKAYPVAVCLSFAGVFIASLMPNKTPVIETIATKMDGPLVPAQIHYTRKVTIVWCVFFLLNASVSSAIALFGSIELWALYNGILSYVFIGLLFLVEYVVRHFFKRRHGLD